jgi:hypothetical protein
MFIQIAVAAVHDPEDGQMLNTLYALDAKGQVWYYVNAVSDNAGWHKLSSQRHGA